MSTPADWLHLLDRAGRPSGLGGIVSVQGYDEKGRPPEEVVVMEKAKAYHAQAVFFEAPHDGKPAVAQAFIYRSDGSPKSDEFAKLHQKLWSWGGVPLVYRVSNGLVQLFRCAHRPDFEKNGQIVCQPFKTLKLTAKIANDPWWDADRLLNGTLWDDAEVCKKLLSSKQSAQKTLINAVRELHEDLNEVEILPKALRRRLLILSVLIAYLEARFVFEEGYFGQFKRGATRFFEVLEDGKALVKLLEALEERFNGHVFELSEDDKDTLRTSTRLIQFRKLVEGREEAGGQLTLWQRYSFADLPVELISHIYQLFVSDKSVAVYTPHFLVRMMLGEVLSWDRLDRLNENDEVILDGACGSGIFLVEAYKRLVLHWRYRNGWAKPKQMVLKRLLTSRIRGVDLEEGAVELAAFSLCLALCDALEPMEIRASVKLFPELKGKLIHTGCFFETREQGRIKDKVGVVVGNPPFASSLTTEGSKRAYDRYQQAHGELPDKQVAYLFLHESMEMLAAGGVLSMLQQYNFLYNQQSLGFRRRFIERWDVREILDFISVRGLFQKGDADTKVIVVVAEAQPPSDRQMLHATFRRSGRTDAEQGFDIDYYDMHWLTRDLALGNDGVWRSDLLGGGRVLGFVDRLRKMRTLVRFIDAAGWRCGEGFTPGSLSKGKSASHICGKPLIDASSIANGRVHTAEAKIYPNRPVERPRNANLFVAPMLLIHKTINIEHGYLSSGEVIYQHEVFGITTDSSEAAKLRELSEWMTLNRRVLLAYVASASVSGFVSKATAILSSDIKHLPYPESRLLNLTPHEEIIVADIVDYHRDLVRLGETSEAMKSAGASALPAFNDLFTSRINGVYKRNKLRAVKPLVLDGVLCQPYIFGNGSVEWPGDEEAQKLKLNTLLREKRGAGLSVTRIARIYDGACIVLIKPDRLRYWLRSVALRDADETLADLSAQGF